MFLALRHFETEKNVKDIHGDSDLNDITAHGRLQLRQAVQFIQTQAHLKRIVYFPTPQCKVSAELLAIETGLEISSSPLKLKAYDLGVLNGLTNFEATENFPNSHQLLERFRRREIDATELSILGSEKPLDLENRLLNWWKFEGKIAVSNSVVVGSNSTLIMLTNLLDNALPTSGKYMCYTIPNGSYRLLSDSINFTSRPHVASSFPDVRFPRLTAKSGSIQTSKYEPSWATMNVTCIICPGYFGNNRFGPYSLFIRLAKELAFNGFTTILLDYLGSGESSSQKRTTETDKESILTTLDSIDQNQTILLIGHSLGCNSVASICKLNSRVHGIAVAPLATINDVLDNMLNQREKEDLLQTGVTSRRGVDISLEYLRQSSIDWLENKSHISLTILAEKDQYSSLSKDDFPVNPTNSSKLSQVKVVDGADHNFSIANSYLQLFNEAKAFANKLSQNQDLAKRVISNEA